MKRILALVMVMILSLALVACGGKEESKAPETTAPAEDVQEPVTTEAPAEQTQATEAHAETAPAEETQTENVKWREFLKEYEAWVDSYVALMKKYKANPTDTSLLTEYANMMNQVAEWSTKCDEMEKELESASPEELAEYAAEVARIAGKMAQAY